jgi:glucosamine--fructose-6-phosphate aminotransferase (isomerizing)
MTQTIMAQEARQAPSVIAAQLTRNNQTIDELSQRLKQINPSLIYIIGRGSSDHAGVFAKYLFEVEMGIPVSSAALSVSGVYGRALNLKGAVALVISQSGRSPDLLKQTESAQENGAFVIALVNDENSPLAQLADAVVPLNAGEEKAVAATKSYLATLSALLHLCARWNEDKHLLDALHTLPYILEQEITNKPQLTLPFLQRTQNAVVLGRGFGYAVGREIALKLKEVLSIHAEAFSSAEFIHGPVTLVENHLKIVDLHIEDESEPFHASIIEDVKQRGAQCTTLNCNMPNVHKRLLPLLLLQRFYLDVEAVAVALGLNPDAPPGLNKVTKTQ